MQYIFDALQPQFTNELRAYHNQRRRWNTQVRFGHVDQTHQQVPSNPSPSEHPGPSSPSTSHSPHASTIPNPIPPNIITASLHSTIHFLNLKHNSLNLSETMPILNNTLVPPTPTKSLNSEDPRTIPNLNNLESHSLHGNPTPPSQDFLGNRNQNASFSSKPTWQPPQESNLQWTWIEGNRPYITKGQSTRPYFEASNTNSDTKTIMFNLDSLNEDRPEVQCQGWDKGCIAESPDSYIKSLVL